MKKTYYAYVSLYIFSYAALGFLLPLIGQYLAQLGFSGMQIGTITATGTAAAIISAAFWGKIYSGSSNKHGLLVKILLCAATVCIALLFIKRYVLFLLTFALMYFFQGAVMGLVDSMTLEANQPFGAVRKWGAVGFALGVYISGKLAEIVNLSIIFPLYSISFVISVIIIIGIIKKNQNTQRANADASYEESQNVSYKQLLNNKPFMQLVICSFFICGTNVANNTYFGFLYTEAGGSIAGIGITFLLMVGSEVPFMAWSEKLSARFSLEKMVLIAMCISVLRFLWYSTCPPPALLIATFFLQGMVNGIVLVEYVRYISKLVPVEYIGLAVSIYYAIGSNCSTIVCQLIGGIILDSYGGVGVYLFFSLFNITGVILYVLFGLEKKR